MPLYNYKLMIFIACRGRLEDDDIAQSVLNMAQSSPAGKFAAKFAYPVRIARAVRHGGNKLKKFKNFLGL